MGFDKPLLDLGSRISVEGGLLNFDLEAQKWREGLIALGLEVDLKSFCRFDKSYFQSD